MKQWSSDLNYALDFNFTAAINEMQAQELK